MAMAMPVAVAVAIALLIAAGTADAHLDDILSVSQGGGFLCKGCLQFATDAQEYLSSPDDLESVVDFVKGHGCASVPAAYKDKCNGMAEEYVSVAFTTLQAYLNPEKMCLETGICTAADNRDVRQGNNCALCRYLVIEMRIKLQDPKAQEKLIEFLLENCQKLQSHEDECKLLVLEYGPQILANVETLLEDDQLCSRIGMCSNSNSLQVQDM